MGHFKELNLTEELNREYSNEELMRLEKQDILFKVSGVRSMLLEYIDRTKYYEEKPSEETLQEIDRALKDITQTYAD